MKDYAKIAQQIAVRSRERQASLAQTYHDAKTESRNLRDMAESGHIEVKRREEIKEIVSWKIPGFVPTPMPLAKYIVSIVDIQPGMTVLEPEAGAGHIADEVPKDADLICVERNYHLAEVLRGKGYKTIYTDFLTWDPGRKFDRIIMNPPFENLEDIAHVRQAYNHLADAGKLVAIMGAGVFFRNDRKAVAFRTWLDGRGEAEPLPDGIFNLSERPTGIKTYLVKIEKTHSGAWFVSTPPGKRESTPPPAGKSWPEKKE